jgi:SAM-dependent methyltransferase
MMPPGARACWVCGGERLSLRKPANYRGALDSGAFAITDTHYGVTAAIYECADCGFLQCAELDDVTHFYEGVEDEAYEAGRAQRRLQLRRVLENVRRHVPGGRLLDIGAASGILVAEAQQMGFRAEGVEPSRWLQRKAVERGLPVHLGTFPNPSCEGPFDVITLVDVIEHVTAPRCLLRAARSALAPHGIVAVVTPDVRSLAARIMRWHWWHFRVAHVGYFDRRTLERAARRSGFVPLAFERPGWFFSGGYLWDRAWKVLGLAGPRAPAVLERVTIPLNLHDSLLAILRPTGETE